MNVLHLDEQREWRGGEQQASWLLQGLVKRGHRVAIAGRPGAPFVTDAHGGVDCPRWTFALRNEGDIFSAWGIARTALQNEIDIIHAHSSHAHMLACLARKLAPQLKVVVSRRVSFPPKSNAITHWKYRQPDVFISVSAEVDRVLRAYGVPDERLALVHSSVDLARVNVEPVPRDAIGVPAEALLLVTAGAMVGHKDHANFIEAVDFVRKEIPHVRGVIAGEGELRPQLEALRAARGLEEHIIFLGHRNDAPALIRAADVYVSSSWSEGLGTSVLEALACGTPVVAAEAGGIPEMVREGETGRLVPNRDPVALAEAILASVRDREAASAMAAKGKRLVEKRFGVDRMVDDTIKVYQGLLAQEDVD